MKKNGTAKLRWFEVVAPGAQAFRGLGKGVGRAHGRRLAQVPESEVGRNADEDRRHVNAFVSV
jgi:hypothetical protein